MQYNGLGSGHVAVDPRSRQDYFQGGAGGRSATYAYANGAPPRPSMSEIRRPSWRSVSSIQPGQAPSHLNEDDDTKPTAPAPFYRNDVVAKHLLVETALLDSHGYEILAIDEVDALKKERAQLDARIESSRRKLALESKVRDAAQSLHRLYSTKDRPSTPQSPKKQRRSLLGGDRGRSVSANALNSPSLNQAGSELDASTKKIDELVQILAGLENRRQYVESRLLRHTAAVLQVAHDDDTTSVEVSGQREADDAGHPFPHNGVPLRENGYADSVYSTDHMDGFLSHVHGGRMDKGLLSIASRGMLPGEQNEKLNDMQSRLERLNSEMRGLISQAKGGRASDTPFEAPSAYPDDDDDDAVGRLATQLGQMESSVRSLGKQQKDTQATFESMLTDSKHDQHAIEARLEGVNNQLYSLLSLSAPHVRPSSLTGPPSVSGHGAQDQINHLEDYILHVEQLLQASHDQRNDSKDLEDAQNSATAHAAIASQYETMLHGLWDIISTSHKHGNDGDNDAKESFSLQAFSTLVQRMFDRASQHDTQVDILRRQIQQQRELNSKSDGEKDRQITDLQASHATLDEQLLQTRAMHAAAETETGDARAELLNVMSELDGLKQAAISNKEQKQKVLSQLEEHRTRIRDQQATITGYELQISDIQDTQGREGELESEVVRLTTEVTVARAALEGAYGSRAERAKEVAMNPEIQAQLSRLEELSQHNTSLAAELEQVRGQHTAASDRSASLEKDLAGLRAEHEKTGTDDARMGLLEKELREMAGEYQDLTRESLELEKEREQLESLVDGLRDRCEVLEAQLGDEKVRWMGIKSPSMNGGDGVGTGAGREMTSTKVLRTEFKKMMRETRAEGVRMLRAEQEERRRLESLLRGLRRDNLSQKTGLGGRRAVDGDADAFPPAFVQGRK